MASDRKVERSVPAVQSSEALLQQMKGVDADNHRQTSAREREREGECRLRSPLGLFPWSSGKSVEGGKKLWEPEGWGTPGEQCPPNQLSKGHGAHRDGSCHRRACTGLL